MEKLIEVIEKDYDVLSKEGLLKIAKSIQKEQESIQKIEQWRIWEFLCKNLELFDDKGDLIDGDNIYNFIFNKTDYNPSFEESARPLMKYLGENHHPHTSAYITNNRAELLEGQEVFGTEDYIVD